MSRNGDDRFYSEARARWSRGESNQSHQECLKRAQSDVTGSKQYNKFSCRGAAAEEDEKASESSVASPEVSLLPLQMQLCNLERFLKFVVPSVPAQYPSQTTVREWMTCATELQPYFIFGDLFDSFNEWSAYGVGVPLVLNENFSVVQYYVPYLSGIQLYGDLSNSSSKSRQLAEDSDGDCFRDSSSDCSSDSENCRGSSIRLLKQRIAMENRHGKNHGAPRDDRITSPEGFCSDESETDSSQGCLFFEYFEENNPYGREPLADKISQLALHFPELSTLRSCDLLPSSWISVAWYPIYRIPMGHTLRDLDACFLTFHCLHTPLTGNETSLAPQVIHPCKMSGEIPKIYLPVFGLACYRFKAPLWIPSGGLAHQLFNSLLQAAETWIAQLQVKHPDFTFFQRR